MSEKQGWHGWETSLTAPFLPLGPRCDDIVFIADVDIRTPYLSPFLPMPIAFVFPYDLMYLCSFA